MTPYNLVFDSQIKKLEELHQWDVAAKLIYQQWKKDPINLNALLCTGAQAWYGLLEIDYDCMESSSKYDRDLFDIDSLHEILIEVTHWGLIHFSENAVFNAYFGYMADIKPYWFWDESEDNWLKKGTEMIRHSNELEPENPITKAFYPNYDGNNATSYDAYMEIWKSFTPEQWGDCSVQKYFFYILDGDRYYPDAYHS